MRKCKWGGGPDRRQSMNKAPEAMAIPFGLISGFPNFCPFYYLETHLLSKISPVEAGQL